MDNITDLQKREGGLSACALKYFAVLAMLTDHIAWLFVDTYSAAGFIMHTIGRLTAPIMTYFIAEGFHYTKNINKYMLRLGIFALISWIPFIYMEFGVLSPVIADEDGSLYFYPFQGVIYTFFLTVAALRTVHSEKLPTPLKVFLVLVLCVLTMIGDWFFFPIVWALLFDRFRGDFKKQAISFVIASVILVTGLLFAMGMRVGDMFQYTVILAVIPLYFYNGERGKILGKGDKWFFYVFYPLHMLVLGAISHFIPNV